MADKHDCTQAAYELVCKALISLIIYGWPVGLAVCGKLLWGHHSSPSADVALGLRCRLAKSDRLEFPLQISGSNLNFKKIAREEAKMGL